MRTSTNCWPAARPCSVGSPDGTAAGRSVQIRLDPPSGHRITAAATAGRLDFLRIFMADVGGPDLGALISGHFAFITLTGMIRSVSLRTTVERAVPRERLAFTGRFPAPRPPPRAPLVDADACPGGGAPGRMETSKPGEDRPCTEEVQRRVAWACDPVGGRGRRDPASVAGRCSCVAGPGQWPRIAESGRAQSCAAAEVRMATAAAPNTMITAPVRTLLIIMGVLLADRSMIH